jgi:outer membrane protein assembly factor BamB
MQVSDSGKKQWLASGARVRRLASVFGMVVLTAAVSGCSWFDSDDRNEPTPLTTFQQKIDATLAWRAPVGSGSSYGFAPAVVGNNVYAASTNGHVARIDLASGATVWNVQTDRTLSAGVGADEGTIAVVTNDAEVIAFDINGTEKWRAKASSEVSHTPWVGNGVVVVRAGDYRVQAFNAENGERLWNVQRPGPALALRAPARMNFVEDLIVTGMPGGRLLAIEPATGAAVWEGIVAAPRGASDLERVNDVVGIPTVLGDVMCAVTYQGRVTCFDIEKGGAIVWAKNFSSVVGLTVDAQHVYAPGARDTVTAFSLKDGEVVWRQAALRNRKLTEPAVLGSAVLFGDFEGFVHALSAENGAFMARVSVGGGAMRSPVISTPQGALVQAGDSSVSLIRLN